MAFGETCYSTVSVARLCLEWFPEACLERLRTRRSEEHVAKTRDVRRVWVLDGRLRLSFSCRWDSAKWSVLSI